MSTTSTALIRNAAPTDSKAAADLLGELGYPQSVDRVHAHLKRTTETERDLALVAEVDGAVLGYVTATFFPMDPEDTWVCRITSLTVAEDARRRGIARQLMSAVAVRAREASCAWIELTSSHQPARDAAHAFYDSLGFEAWSETAENYRLSL